MQLDTDDGETFVPPAGVVASPTKDNETLDSSQSQISEGDTLVAAESTREIEE
jgi:sorting nexin-1/2